MPILYGYSVVADETATVVTRRLHAAEPGPSRLPGSNKYSRNTVRGAASLKLQTQPV